MERMPLTGRVSPVRAELADDGVVARPIEGHLAAAQEQPQRDRQVEPVGVLLEIGRSEVASGGMRTFTMCPCAEHPDSDLRHAPQSN